MPPPRAGAGAGGGALGLRGPLAGENAANFEDLVSIQKYRSLAEIDAKLAQKLSQL